MKRLLICSVLAAMVMRAWAADFDARRARMVKDQIESRGITNTAVLAAMRNVSRHEFVPERLREHAYDDRPLPIGYDQTISQPYIVALMTEVLRLERGAKVLEIGTGSGYQAAVLAAIATNVFTIEIIEPLATAAAARLKRLGYDNVHVKFGDGFLGWPEHAPFDAIIVTAAPDAVPPPLLKQLKPGGRLVIPLGSPSTQQKLVLMEKDKDGNFSTRTIEAVKFVPLTRDLKR